MKKEKGQYGYLHYKKVYQLFMTLVCLMAVLGIMMAGFWYYKTFSNVFTVMAVVLVIPAAKFGVGYIVLIPYKAPLKERYDAIRKEEYRLLSGLVITSSEKIMGVDFVAVKGKRAYCFVSERKIKAGEIEKYLREILNSEFNGVGVKVYTDFHKYQEALEKLKDTGEDITDKRITELLCIYSM